MVRARCVSSSGRPLRCPQRSRKASSHSVAQRHTHSAFRAPSRIHYACGRDFFGARPPKINGQIKFNTCVRRAPCRADTINWWGVFFCLGCGCWLCFLSLEQIIHAHAYRIYIYRKCMPEFTAHLMRARPIAIAKCETSRKRARERCECIGTAMLSFGTANTSLYLYSMPVDRSR